MNILIFNGSLESQSNTTPTRIARAFTDHLEQRGATVTTFHLSEAGIPLFDFSFEETPSSVVDMVSTFRAADMHIWLTPLYHGSMTGAMKNCLDWLEISAREEVPYLTNKIIGLVCWADGAQAMQGINAMDAVAKALRAWVLPYSIPIVRGNLFVADNQEMSPDYLEKIELMSTLLSDRQPSNFTV
jgi:arsenical resistance protein ArsH